jgi:hypothetical protein
MTTTQIETVGKTFTLIANKQAISSTNDFLDNTLITLTRGMSTIQQQIDCYNQMSNKEALVGSDSVMGDDSFELWYKRELIGLCQFAEQAQDSIYQKESCEDDDDIEFDQNTLYIKNDLSGVFILPKHRNQGLGDFMASQIGVILFHNLMGTLHSIEFSHINNVSFHCTADYESAGGQAFHETLLQDFSGNYLTQQLKDLGVECDIEIDAGF